MFSDPSPKLNDSDNNLLFKIAQMLSQGVLTGGSGSITAGDIATALGFTPVAPSLKSVYATGTGPEIQFDGAYILNFSGVDPSITFSASGTYLVFARVRVDAETLTLDAQELVLSVVRVAPAPVIDIPNALTTTILPAFTAETRTVGTFTLAVVVYTASGSTDKLQLAAALASSAPVSGTLRATEASIVAFRIS